MIDNVLCHIVGINNNIKEDTIKYLLDKYKKLVIVDLDKLSEKISTDNVIDELYTKYNKYNERGMINDAKHIERKIGKYWQVVLAEKIQKILELNTKKKIVFLGLSTYQKNYDYGINFGRDVPSYFFKTNIKKNAQDIIRYNLDKYKKYIIDGDFPLKLIDLDYLINKREEIINHYITKKKYEYKTLNSIINHITMKMDQYESINNIPKLYVGSSNKYDNIIDLNNITAYTEDWLAIISMIPNINKKLRKVF